MPDFVNHPAGFCRESSSGPLLGCEWMRYAPLAVFFPQAREEIGVAVGHNTPPPILVQIIVELFFCLAILDRRRDRYRNYSNYYCYY